MLNDWMTLYFLTEIGEMSEGFHPQQFFTRLDAKHRYPYNSPYLTYKIV